MFRLSTTARLLRPICRRQPVVILQEVGQEIMTAHRVEYFHSTTQQLKNEAKKGKHLENLKEFAHAESRKQSREKRKNKKAGKSKGKDDPPAAAAAPMELENDDPEFEDYEDDETILPDPTQVQGRMTKVLDSFVESLKSIRGAEPTPEMFDKITVVAYGSNAPLNSVAQVVLTSSTLAQATCYDPDLAKNVSNAIRDQLQLNPSIEDGGVVKIPLPRVSLEVREQTSKALAKRTEKYRQRIRMIRRNVLKVVKQGEAGKLEGVSKDDAFRSQKEIEAVTDKVMTLLNEALEKKQRAIMEV